MRPSVVSFFRDAVSQGRGLDLIRFYLGVGLFVRGALFISHPDVLFNYMERTNAWFVPLALSHYVVMAHLCGGVMLALGLLTRVAAAAQIPPLLGAVFYVHYGEGLLSAGQSLEFAGLVLFLLVVFTITGAGAWSLDHALQHSEDVREHRVSDVPARPAVQH